MLHFGGNMQGGYVGDPHEWEDVIGADPPIRTILTGGRCKRCGLPYLFIAADGVCDTCHRDMYFQMEGYIDEEVAHP